MSTALRSDVVDVVIVGAGVIGLSLALRLRAAGLSVCLVERGEVAGEASTAAAGILSAQAESHEGGPLFELMLRSRALYESWARELGDETGIDVGYRRCGVLMLDEPTDAAALASRAAWQRALGLRVEILTRDEVEALEPELAPEGGALHFADDGQVDPRRLCAALVEALRRRNVGVHSDEALELLSAGGAGDAAVTGVVLRDGGSISAGAVVLCTGSWAGQHAGLGFPAQVVEPVRGQVLELRRPSLQLHNVVFGHSRSGSGGYLVPRGDGRVLIGATVERTGFVKQVTAGGVQSLLQLSTELVPRLAQAEFVAAWAGLRPGSRDGLPVLGRSSRPGLYFSAGHFRNGILLAPISAALVADELLGRSDPAATALLQAFSPSRLYRNLP